MSVILKVMLRLTQQNPGIDPNTLKATNKAMVHVRSRFTADSKFPYHYFYGHVMGMTKKQIYTLLNVDIWMSEKTMT